MIQTFPLQLGFHHAGRLRAGAVPVTSVVSAHNRHPESAASAAARRSGNASRTEMEKRLQYDCNARVVIDEASGRRIAVR